MALRMAKALVVAGTTAVLAVSAGTTASAAPAASCYASGGNLYCGNVANAAIYKVAHWTTPPSPNPTPVVDRLLSTHSYFKCYVHGDDHPGGNNVWYSTYGDINGAWGWVPANQVYTPTDPFPGVDHC